jgi:zinc protease
MQPPVSLTLLPSPLSPLVSFRILFRAGSVDDPRGKEGITYLTTALLAQGGTRSLSYAELLEALYPMAARLDAQADKETVVILGQCHRDHLRRFYPLLRDTILDPRFDAADFTRLRDEAVNYLEKQLRGNDDENLGKAALQAALYESHPYGPSDVGTVRGLKALTREDVMAHFKRHFTRERVDLGLAGGYPEELAAELARDFAALPSAPSSRPFLPEPRRPRGIEITVVEKPCIATALSLGYATALTRAHADWVPLLIANSYLGEHRTFNGVLMNELRGKRGLNYGDYSYLEHFIQDGGTTFPVTNIPRRQQYFSIWLRPVAHRNAAFALRGALYYLDRTLRKGIPEAEFQATRSFLKTYTRLWAQSLDQRLGYLQDSRIYGIPDYLEALQERLPQLTVEEVNAAMRRHLRATDLVVAAVTENAQALLNPLLEGAPTPITYDTSGTLPEVIEEDRLIERFPLAVNQERSRKIAPGDLFES